MFDSVPLVQPGWLLIRYLIYPQIRYADTIGCSGEEDSGMLCRMIGFHNIGVWRKKRPFNRKVTKKSMHYTCLVQFLALWSQDFTKEQLPLRIGAKTALIQTLKTMSMLSIYYA